MVLPAVLLDIEACAGRSAVPVDCGVLSLLRSEGAAASGCCICSMMLECLHDHTSLWSGRSWRQQRPIGGSRRDHGHPKFIVYAQHQHNGNVLRLGMGCRVPYFVLALLDIVISSTTNLLLLV